VAKGKIIVSLTILKASRKGKKTYSMHNSFVSTAVVQVFSGKPSLPDSHLKHTQKTKTQKIPITLKLSISSTRLSLHIHIKNLTIQTYLWGKRALN